MRGVCLRVRGLSLPLAHSLEWEVKEPRTCRLLTKLICPLQLVTACAMQAFHSLFHAKPGPGTLPAELNAQIITVRPGMGRGVAMLGCGGPVTCLQGEVEWAGQAAPLQKSGRQAARRLTKATSVPSGAGGADS